MSIGFRFQTYCADQEGGLSLTEPQDVAAASYDEAARIACGGDVLPVGSRGKLAVKIWKTEIGGGQPKIKLYYRP
jgi:hypothetical protein